MATVDREPPETHEDPRRLYEDADKLLRLAENYQDRCEAYDRRRWRLVWLFFTSLLVLFLAVALMATAPFAQWSEISYFIFFIVIAYTSFAYFTYLWFYQSYVKLANRERRTLYSIVDMLRELEKGIAEESGLTVLERAEFRIRLSRFDIGPGWPEHHARP